MSTHSGTGADSTRGVGADLVSQRQPLVSLCIPAFQAARHLRRTVESVLAQSFADMEILILDNNSTDGTGAILEDLEDERVRVIRNETTLPIADNWNLLVAKSRGRFVKIVCADDTLEPDCVAAQVQVLRDNSSVALVAARTDFIDDRDDLLRPARGLGGLLGRRSGVGVVRRIVRSGGNPVGPSAAVMFRHADFDLCGGFRGDLVFPMDVDLWSRLMVCGDLVGLPQTLASFRLGSDTTTARMSVREQFRQQAEFARRLAGDPRWAVSRTDRLLGWTNSFDMQVRRRVLYAISAAQRHDRRRTGRWIAGGALKLRRFLDRAPASMNRC